MESPKGSEISHGRRKVVAGVITLVSGVGIAALVKNALQDDDAKNPSPSKSESREALKYTYEIDGCMISSNTVDRATFTAAYEPVKEIIGGPYWKPERLSIEFGNVANQDGYPTGTYVHRVSHTSEDKTKIITNPQDLRHELGHFLIGPNDMPEVVQEVLAYAGEESLEDRGMPYEDLDKPWVQMPTDESINAPFPFTAFRRVALSHIGWKNRDKMKTIVPAARAQKGMKFEDAARFFEQFGIKHHILSPGETGEFFGAIPTTQDGQKGYSYVRYKREKGNSTEFPWQGPLQIIWLDEENKRYVLNSGMQGATFFPLPPPHDDKKLVKLVIIHPDGEAQFNLNY